MQRKSIEKTLGVANVKIRTLGTVVSLEIRIPSSNLENDLPMANEYYALPVFPELAEIMSKRNSSLIVYVPYSTSIIGQINILNSGVIQLGFLRNLTTGAATDWPKTSSLYLEYCFAC